MWWTVKGQDSKVHAKDEKGNDTRVKRTHVSEWNPVEKGTWWIERYTARIRKWLMRMAHGYDSTDWLLSLIVVMMTLWRHHYVMYCKWEHWNWQWVDCSLNFSGIGDSNDTRRMLEFPHLWGRLRWQMIWMLVKIEIERWIIRVN